MPVGEQDVIRLAMDHIPVLDYEDLIERAVTSYCESDAVPDGMDTVELVGVTVEKDQLSLIAGQNHKSLNNLVIRIELAMEAVDPLEYSAIVSDNDSALLDYLFDGYYAFYKAQDFSIQTTSKNGHKETLPGHKFTSHETVFLAQLESEYALQTLAFHFAEENDDFVLEKFGALPDEKELYIEYYVDDGYLFAEADSYGERVEALEANTANLSEVCKEIVEMIMTGDEARTYMEENGLTAYTIASKNGNWEDGYQLFHEEYPN